MAAARSIFQFFSSHEGHRCGYCKQTDTNLNMGMWAHKLTCQDYQDLIDRGWRRSGHYVYKPTMKQTCCPQYTIRCHALDYKPTKSHKKVLKKMRSYLINGLPEKAEGECGGEKPKEVSEGVEPTRPEEEKKPVAVKPGVGADPSKEPCKKAKIRRMERKQEKLAARARKDGVAVEEIQAKKTNNPGKEQPACKPLAEFLTADVPDGTPKHKLEVKLVAASYDDPDFDSTANSSWKVYQKYQMIIHKDEPSDCNKSQWRRFLVDSPLIREEAEGLSHGLGSFHQQYWLDDKLIAVGVLDILPHCVSSVYLYYDPDYGFLSPGVYSAVREIQLTRELHSLHPVIQFYYMGFYIHTCPKMKYKGQYTPSDLLCPETFKWCSLQNCAPKLDENKYSRFDEGDEVCFEDVPVELEMVLVLWQRQGMPYQIYRALRHPDDEEEDDEEITTYTRLAGPAVSQRALLFRES